MNDLISRLRARLTAERAAPETGHNAADREQAELIRLLTNAAAALEEAREDAERLAFLASEPVVEGFVGDEKYIYDYACDAAEEAGRDEPSEADMLAGLRRMLDAVRKEGNSE